MSLRKIRTESTLLILGQKYEAMEYYSKGPPCCVDCGIHDLRDLVLDHVNGGGCEERRKHCLGIGGHKYYRYLRAQGYPDDIGLEVRCGDCHRERHKLEKKAKRLLYIASPIDFDPANPIPGAVPQSLWDEVA